MIVNRYTQTTPSVYNPMSLQELAFAPQFLRQRHDETMAANQLLTEQLGQYDVLPGFQDTATQLISPLEQESQTLAQDLSRRGIRESGAVDRLMKLSAQQKNLFSPRGGIGQLQQRTQQVRETQKQISDFFKDNPELASFISKQIKPGEAVINPETGRLELGEFQAPQYYRHIPDEDIMKQMDDAVRTLQPETLRQFGIQYAGKLGGFNDLFRVAKEKGVRPDRMVQLMGALLGPEIQNSVAQYGRMMGYSPEESINMLTNRLANVASARAYATIDDQYFNVTDHAAVKRLNEEVPSTPFITPGGQFEGAAINPFMDVKIGDGDSIISVASENPEAWKERGYRVVYNEGDKSHYVYGPQGGNPVYVISPERQHNVTASAQQFLDYKNSIPELRNLSNKEAKERIDEYTKNLKTQYQHITNPGESRILKTLTESIMGDGGDITNRRILHQRGGSGDFAEVMDELGYSDYNEFVEAAGQIKGYRMIAGEGLYYEAKVKDQKDTKKLPASIFIKADPEIEEVFKKSSAINNAIVSGKIVETVDLNQRLDRTTGEPFEVYTTVINNPGTNKQPLVVESFEPLDQQDILGMTPNQMLEKYGKTNIRFRSVSDIMLEEAKLVEKNLSGKFK